MIKEMGRVINWLLGITNHSGYSKTDWTKRCVIKIWDNSILEGDGGYRTQLLRFDHNGSAYYSNWVDRAQNMEGVVFLLCSKFTAFSIDWQLPQKDI